MNKLIVISGCSGGGKSTLLSELSKMGYTVFPEVGREIVKEQLAINGKITPGENPQAFCELLISRSIAVFHEAINMKQVKDDVIFLDRSFLEGISYYQNLKNQDSSKYDHFITELRYYPTIFMTPPWKEIFSHDYERKHSFEDALKEYDRLMKDFPKFGYNVIEFPKTTVQERIAFLLAAI